MVASMSDVRPISYYFFFPMTFCMMDFTEKEGLLIV